eukprot:363983-Chlamydomonas_euryale.AAC.4
MGGGHMPCHTFSHLATPSRTAAAAVGVQLDGRRAHALSHIFTPTHTYSHRCCCSWCPAGWAADTCLVTPFSPLVTPPVMSQLAGWMGGGRAPPAAPGPSAVLRGHGCDVQALAFVPTAEGGDGHLLLASG